MPKGVYERPSLEERFWGKVHKTESCWLWTAALNTHGYGCLQVAGHAKPAHRIAYELLIGPIPRHLEIDHLCRVRRCVRPSHLDAVPHQVNTLRGVGPSATNKRKTTCHLGHPLSGENLYAYKGTRSCRTCRNQASRRYRLPS